MAKAGQKMIRKAGARNEAFSKRRSSIFRKAAELSVLCAVEMAVIIFSPGGRAYSFSPSVEKIIDRFTHPGSPDAPSNELDSSGLADLYKKYSDALVQLNAEKKRGKKPKRRGFPIDSMNMDDLLKLNRNLEALRQDIHEQMTEVSSQTPVRTSDFASSAAVASKSVNTHPTGLIPDVDAHSHDFGY